MSLEENRISIARFNRWARTYDRGHLNPWFTRGQAKVLEALQLKGDDWLLDVGCGTGWAVIHAAQLTPAGRACGIDLSPGMIERAKENAEGFFNIEFQVADAEAIPYPPESFDAVISTHSFHHYSDPLRALAEIHRVLKRGGQIVILDSNRGACLWVWLWDRILRAFERGHVQYYTEEELSQLMSKAGYANAVVVNSDHGHLRNGKIGWAMSMIRAEKK